MSLDVHLTLESAKCLKSGIFIREGGQIKEVTRKEWDARFPDREPIVANEFDGEVYWANITHNLNKMADAANIYEYLWRPDELGIEKANQLIEPLRQGLSTLIANPAGFKEFNPPNGWGTYEGLVEFVRNYLTACEKYPEAKVYVSR